jgi:phosphoribosyl-ATP pyrophosphohydrolase / phosphoribosyl-AMP cyclohydrolase / histidinol dehydrogenase
MAAVGRCRIEMPHYVEEYDPLVVEIYDTCEAQTDCAKRSDLSAEEVKKLQKKLRKQSVALASKYFREICGLDLSIIDVEAYYRSLHKTDAETAANYICCLLDAGCARVVIPYYFAHQNMDEIFHQIIQTAAIPRERLMVHIEDDVVIFAPVDRDIALVERFRESCSSISFDMKNASTKVDFSKLLEMSKSISDMDIVISIPSSNNLLEENGAEYFATIVGEVLKSSTPKDRCGTTICLTDPTPELLGLSYAACISSDREDRLYPTVVCTRTNEALGLVYSSISSIVAALDCGRGVYYSRSRNGLWRKGDTSGHYQTLHRIDVDCDGDALRFTVTQNSPTENTTQSTGNNENSNTLTATTTPAAFCHLETLTCWGAPRGIRHLEATLQDRLHNATEGSYTQRLFQDRTLLRDKLVEEAQELAEADTAQHVAEELADVLYFSLVRAAQFGITLEDATIELDRRARKVTRRAGDSKAFRIEAAQSILNKVEDTNADTNL